MFRPESLRSICSALSWTFFCLVCALPLAGCGGGHEQSQGADSTSSGLPLEGAGTLQLSVTDTPACGYRSVNLTIQKIRVHQNSTASETDSGWSEMVLSPAKRIDLLTLNDKGLALLGQMPVLAGRYKQMSLILANNDGSHPLANSVVLASGAEAALTTSGGQHSSLKLGVELGVSANNVTDVVLDIDACQSIVATDVADQYQLLPTAKVKPHQLSGVIGYLDTSLVNGLTKVSVQQMGVVVKATTPDSAGKFLLQSVAPGLYDVVITEPTHATMVITGVPVVADTVTAINNALVGLKSPASSHGRIVGSVVSNYVPTVQLQQTLSGGHPIEVAGGACFKSFEYELAADAPWVATYAATSDALKFVADASDGVANTVIVKATANGETHTSGPRLIDWDNGGSSPGGVTIVGDLLLFLFL